MIIELYHGSKEYIDHPKYGLGKPYNDYGRGYYCTKNIFMAMEWAVSESMNGFANCYELDCKGLSFLDLNDANHCILNWLAVLLDNREFDCHSALASEGKQYILKHFLPEYEKYDVIIGYRADDSYFSFAQDFLSGTISYRQLCESMYLGDLGTQYVLKSKRSFDHLTFLGCEMADDEEWFPKKLLRDQTARARYFSDKKMQRQKGDIFITQILDEEMEAGDERLK